MRFKTGSDNGKCALTHGGDNLRYLLRGFPLTPDNLRKASGYLAVVIDFSDV
ncbi:MAG: hypothetical protein N3D76_02495 [Geminocystis sp.]|nr:hypothetical protein [Geminocystis sp.]HIK37601.1 hypothetical protein [Geminocystis sp. M7585_C2015_104]